MDELIVERPQSTSITLLAFAGAAGAMFVQYASSGDLYRMENVDRGQFEWLSGQDGSVGKKMASFTSKRRKEKGAGMQKLTPDEAQRWRDELELWERRACERTRVLDEWAVETNALWF